jgi:hypothetical protein
MDTPDDLCSTGVCPVGVSVTFRERLVKQLKPERRPKRHGEASEARRIEAGFRILAGEGVYVDETDEA